MRCGESGLPELFICVVDGLAKHTDGVLSLTPRLIQAALATAKPESEIDTATGFLPVAVAGRIGAIASANFLWRRPLLDVVDSLGSVAGVDCLSFCNAFVHGSSMPEGKLKRMNTHMHVANGYNPPAMSIDAYSTIAVSGEDAVEFLQAQLAGDLRKVQGAEPLLSAWCNPKGRVICLFRVSSLDGGFALALPADLADEAVRRLTLYRFRAAVSFEIRAARARELGLTSGVAEWQLDNLKAGIVEIRRAQSEAFTPHMLNLDLLGAVSLDKGCYPGQEVVARTHYRGATKRRLHRFEAEKPVAVGDKVSNDERTIGEIVNAIGKDVLAVVPLDQAAANLTVSGIPLRPVALPYL